MSSVNYLNNSYIGNTLREDCQPNLMDIDKQVCVKMLYIVRFYHMVHLVYKDLNIDSQYRLCYPDSHYRAGIHLFWLSKWI